MKQDSGYTLLEILIALSVFAILATITASSMYYAFHTREQVNIQADQLNALQVGLTLMERDTEQILERSIRGNEMRMFPPFVGQSSYVEFTRGGIVNPDGIEAHSSLARVAYRCAGKQLIRMSWKSLDTPSREQSQQKVIFDDLDECSFAYLANNRQTLSEWREYAVQQNQKKETLPTAIQLTLTFHNWGNLSLFFPLPESLYGS